MFGIKRLEYNVTNILFKPLVSVKIHRIIIHFRSSEQGKRISLGCPRLVQPSSVRLIVEPLFSLRKNHININTIAYLSFFLTCR